MRQQPQPALDHPHRDLAAAIDAITACDPADLTEALYDAGADTIARIAAATRDAAHHAAYYPRHEVIAEADALLYDTLRWPITDTDPFFPRPEQARVLAAHRGITVDDAERLIDHLLATENDACHALLQSGVEPIYTLGQAQVFTCIQAIADTGQAPTRALIRAHANSLARGSLRPGQGTDPVVYPHDPALKARAVSNHSAVHAILWLDHHDKTTTPIGLLSQRIEYLAHAKRASRGASAVAHALCDTSALHPPAGYGRDGAVQTGTAILA